MEVTAQEARMITKKKITDDKRREKESKDECRQEAEKWAQKKFPGKIKSALAQIKWAAAQGETYADISLTVINKELREVLLAELVIKKLRESEFSIYYKEYYHSNRKMVSDYSEGGKRKEHYASWGPKPTWVNGWIAVK